MKFALASSAIIATALAATHQVTIGPGLFYSPSSVTAATGDVVLFKFGAGHNVVSGSFNSPCQPDGKIYSGDGSEGDIFGVTINGTDPVWIYCSVSHHCQGGMAMVINPPSSGNTLDEYKSAASSVSSSSQPSNVVGGIYGNSASGSSSSSSSSSSTSSAASSMMSSASRTASSSGTATASSAMTSSSSGAQNVGVGMGLLGLSALWSVLFA